MIITFIIISLLRFWWGWRGCHHRSCWWSRDSCHYFVNHWILLVMVMLVVMMMMMRLRSRLLLLLMFLNRCSYMCRSSMFGVFLIFLLVMLLFLLFVMSITIAVVVMLLWWSCNSRSIIVFLLGNIFSLILLLRLRRSLLCLSYLSLLLLH